MTYFIASPSGEMHPSDAANALSRLTGVAPERCENALTQLLLAGYRLTHPDTGLRVFAFKLNQFIDRGDTVYASLEPEESRYLTLEPQLFVPSSRDKLLLPRGVRLAPDGREDPGGLLVHLLPAPFKFCLHCGVAYPGKQSEFGKLGVLSAEGRASATTVLSLAAILQLRGSEVSGEAWLPERARKLLSFTDNRQDASLQAGHLNDFVEISLLRAALYRAMRDAAAGGLEHDSLTQAVFRAMALDLAEYAVNPEVLDIYDELARCKAEGREYRTRLEPPAADVRVAHPEREVELS